LSVFFIVPAPPQLYTLSLHDALPISTHRRRVSRRRGRNRCRRGQLRLKQAAYEALDLLADLGRAYRIADKLTRRAWNQSWFERRSEEHTSELQSPCNLVCRLLLEKKK